MISQVGIISTKKPSDAPPKGFFNLQGFVFVYEGAKASLFEQTHLTFDIEALTAAPLGNSGVSAAIVKLKLLPKISLPYANFAVKDFSASTWLTT